MNLTKAIYTRLVTDPTITGSLSSFNGTSSVFFSTHAPDSASLPYIISRGAWSIQPWDNKTSQGQESYYDIGIYTSDNDSISTLETITDRVRTLLHRYNLPVTGSSTVMCECSDIGISPYEDQVQGRIVTIRLINSNN